MTFRMRQHVTILFQPKADGSHNHGIILGIDYEQDGFYLGYRDYREWIAQHTVPRYKVCYIDCVTNRACTGWYQEHQLAKK